MGTQLKPYGGLSRHRLTELINSANQSSLIEGIDFEYGSPEKLIDHPKHNTKVRLFAKRPGKADVDITYTRLGIHILANLPPEMLGEILIDALPLNVRSSIDDINQALGLDLVADEIEDFIFYDERSSYPIRIRGRNSLAWLTSEINVRARHAVPLFSIWPNTELDGLYPPVN